MLHTNDIKNKAAERAEIEAQIKAFRKAGGKVQRSPIIVRDKPAKAKRGFNNRDLTGKEKVVA